MADLYDHASQGAATAASSAASPAAPASSTAADPAGPGEPASEPGEAGVQGHGAGEEKRRFPRAVVALAVQVKFGSVREFLNATAEDLSVGGMFLRSQHFGEAGGLRQLGSLLALQFDAGNRHLVHGVGRVVRVILPGVAGVEPGVGVEFVELDEPSRRLVEAIVDIKLAQTSVG